MTVPPVPDVRDSWYYARFQAVGRAQARYLLTSFVISAYTVALSFTTGSTAPFLGLILPKSIVAAGAVVVLGVLLLAVLGTFLAADQAFTELQTHLGDRGKALKMHHVDQHPSIMDFLSYVSDFQRWGALVLYPVPVVAVSTWTAALWLGSLNAWPLADGWLKGMLVLGGMLIIAVVFRLVVYLGGRWTLFRAPRRKGRPG